jgi:hypothetical protein
VVASGLRRRQLHGGGEVVAGGAPVLLDEGQEGGRGRCLDRDVRRTGAVCQRLPCAALHLVATARSGVDVRLERDGGGERPVQAVPAGQLRRAADHRGGRIGVVTEHERGSDLYVDDGSCPECSLVPRQVPGLLEADHRPTAEHVDGPQLVQRPRTPQRETVGLGEGQ